MFTKRKSHFITLVVAILGFALPGCNGQRSPEINDTSSESSTSVPTNSLSSDDINEYNADTSPATLVIWIPASIISDTQDSTLAILDDRLNMFSERHPGVRVQIRIKADTGNANLYNSLKLAQEAAPLSIPDLVLLPSNQLKIAARNNYIFPFSESDEITKIFIEEADWFPLAIDQSKVNDIVYGLPVQLDILVMAYRSDIIDQAPASWAALLDSSLIFSFPAADPESLFSIAQLLSSNAVNLDNQNYFISNEDIVLNYFNFLNQAQLTGVIPFWLTQYEDFGQSWISFLENRSQLSLIWLSDYLTISPERTSIASFPTSDGEAYTVSEVWSWAIPVNSIDADRFALASELAIFLTDSNFIDELSKSTKLLPTRKGAIQNMEELQNYSIIQELLNSPVFNPIGIGTESFKAALSNATISVLKNSLSPQEAMQLVLNAISP